MKLCSHCRTPVVQSKSRDYCTDRCMKEAQEEARLDAKRPTRKTTPRDIEIAYQRALAAQRAGS